MSETPKPVREVRVDDLIDLHGDQYADPEADPHLDLAYEYARVEEIERETPNCIVLHTSLTSVGFPPDHEVRVCDTL